MKKIIRLTESDLNRIVKRIIRLNEEDDFINYDLTKEKADKIAEELKDLYEIFHEIEEEIYDLEDELFDLGFIYDGDQAVLSSYNKKNQKKPN